MYCDICHQTMPVPYVLRLFRPGYGAQADAEVFVCHHCYNTIKNLMPKEHSKLPDYLNGRYLKEERDYETQEV